jgi:hypothetical protein
MGMSTSGRRQRERELWRCLRGAISLTIREQSNKRMQLAELQI